MAQLIFHRCERVCAWAACARPFTATTNTHRYCCDEHRRADKYGIRACEGCGREFVPTRASQRFHNKLCSEVFSRRTDVRNAIRAASRPGSTRDIWRGAHPMRLPIDALKSWGFRRDPFAGRPRKISELFMSRQHVAVRDVLIDRINNCDVAALIAMVQWGKSMLWDVVRDILDNSRDVGYMCSTVQSIDSEHVTANSILHALYYDIEGKELLGVGGEKFSRAVVDVVKARAREGKRIVLCIDEADKIDKSGLRAVKVLRDKCRLGISPCLSIVLLGQEEFSAILARHEYREIGGRVEPIRPGPLSVQDGEIRAYIRWQIALATLDRAPTSAELAGIQVPFTEQALAEIDSQIGAIATIGAANTVCSHALKEALDNGEDRADAEHVREARAHLTQGVF